MTVTFPRVALAVRVYVPDANAYDEVAHHEPLPFTTELATTTPLAVVTVTVAHALPLPEI